MLRLTQTSDAYTIVLSTCMSTLRCRSNANLKLPSVEHLYHATLKANFESQAGAAMPPKP